MKLLLPISMIVLAVVSFYLAEKKTKFQKLQYRHQQVIIGVVFGAISCFASEFGVDLLGTVANVRDAAPLSAGLIFGGPAGIISGIIGGLYRWFSVYWGAGTYTRLACTIATILAGIMAALLRKLMFDDKKPTWSYAIAITVFCEVMHMLLIFITNMGDSVHAFDFVQGATFPVIIGNVSAVGASFVIISLISHEGIKQSRANEHIAETFQRWLLICIVVAYFATSAFTFILQNGMISTETNKLFASVLKDAKNDIVGKSNEYMLTAVEDMSKRYLEGESIYYLQHLYSVAEINLIDEDGDIIDSTDPSVIDEFNMYTTDQSRQFMYRVKEEGTYVQAYGAMGNDQTVMRKYAGMALNNGKYLQIGYNTEQFRGLLDHFVIDVTKNRHVGTSGFVAVCDENMMMVTAESSLYYGKTIDVTGIVPKDEMLVGKDASHLYTAVVNDAAGEYSEKHYYSFVFVEGYCVIAAMPESEAMFMRDVSIYNSVFSQVLVFAVLFVFIYILINRVIIRNLRKINNTLGRITEGDLSVTVDVRSNEEFASLSDDINSTVSTLKRYIAEAAARIDRELEYAKQIQLSALPTNFPDTPDYSIYARMIAAKEVGGDFYDFYQFGDDTVAFLAADVSGKGIPAAMFMMTAKTIIKGLAETGLPVNEILTKANEKLCENNESGMFVTAWMGILDLRSGRLQYANAGHNPPLIRRGDGSFEYIRSRAGFVLAGMEGVRYRVGEIMLSRGDRVFLYTDGVTEATNSANELYGDDRLLEFMNSAKALPATELLPALKADIDSFVGEAPQFDDITMVVFDYKEKERGTVVMTDRSFPAEVDALHDVIAFVEESLEEYGCSMKISMAVCVAIEEVFVNVAHYAYGEGKGDVKFSIGFDEKNREVIFVMADGGIPFDPLGKPDPDVTLSAGEREIGGLGIFITKKTMDSVEYRYENGENVLTMIKKI